MANELTISASLTYADSFDVAESVTKQNFQRTPATLKPVKTIQTINTSETALLLGDGNTLTGGDMWVRNLDATNYVEIKVAAAGAIFCKLLPGRFCLVPPGSGMTAPVAIANTAAVKVEIMTVPV